MSGESDFFEKFGYLTELFCSVDCPGGAESGETYHFIRCSIGGISFREYAC